MSTATVETPNEGSSRRSSGSRPRSARDANRNELAVVRQHTEAAVIDLIGASTDAVRTFLPTAMLRPTEAVEFSFDVAEQFLAGARRICVEIATAVEAGLQAGLERRAA